jgi:hypothetical protein
MDDRKMKFNIEGIDNELIKKTALVYIGVVFLAMVAVLFVFPRVSDLLALRRSVSNEDNKIAKLKESFSLLDQFETRLGKSNIQLIDMALPANFDPGSILLQLRKLSNSNGVTISSYSLNGGDINSGDGDKDVLSKKIETKETVKTKGSKNTEFNIVLSGSADKLILFMEDLEKSLPLAQVSEVKASEIINVVKGNDLGNKVELSLKINYYYFPYRSILSSESVTLDDYLISSDDLMLLNNLSSYERPTKNQNSGMVGGGNGNLFSVD